MTGHAFIQHFIQKVESLIPRIICHYAICASLHMRSSFNFRVQSNPVFTCTLNRIKIGINHPLQFNRNFIPIVLNQIDYGVYMKAFQSDWAINPITNRLFGCM